MSDPASSDPTDWPIVVRLRAQIADQATQAVECQVTSGCSHEEALASVRVAVIRAADRIATSVLDAAEMALDVWAVTR